MDETTIRVLVDQYREWEREIFDLDAKKGELETLLLGASQRRARLQAKLVALHADLPVGLVPLVTGGPTAYVVARGD